MSGGVYMGGAVVASITWTQRYGTLSTTKAEYVPRDDRFSHGTLVMRDVLLLLLSYFHTPCISRYQDSEGGF